MSGHILYIMMYLLHGELFGVMTNVLTSWCFRDVIMKVLTYFDVLSCLFILYIEYISCAFPAQMHL